MAGKLKKIVGKEGCTYRVEEDWRPGVAMANAAQVLAGCGGCLHRKDHLPHCAGRQNPPRRSRQQALLRVLRSPNPSVLTCSAAVILSNF